MYSIVPILAIALLFIVNNEVFLKSKNCSATRARSSAINSSIVPSIATAATNSSSCRKAKITTIAPTTECTNARIISSPCKNSISVRCPARLTSPHYRAIINPYAA